MGVNRNLSALKPDLEQAAQRTIARVKVEIREADNG